MAIGSGLAAQIGFAKEAVYGTAVTVDRFVPFLSESLTQEIDRIQSEGIIPNARTWRSEQWAKGNITIGGDVGVELYDRGLLLLAESMFGARATTGAGPYTHTMTPGDVADDSMTIQVGRPDSGGTVRPFTYLGCQVASWELACSEGEIATLGMTIAGREESRAIALAAAAIPAGMKPLSYNHGTITIGGAAVGNVKSATVSGDNGLDIERRFFNAGGKIAQPIQTGLRTYTATLETEFTDLTTYDRFVDGTEAALSLKFTLGTHSVEITGNIRTDGATPTVGGKEILTQSTEVTFMGPTDDASAISLIVISSDALP